MPDPDRPPNTTRPGVERSFLSVDAICGVRLRRSNCAAVHGGQNERIWGNRFPHSSTAGPASRTEAACATQHRDPPVALMLSRPAFRAVVEKELRRRSSACRLAYVRSDRLSNQASCTGLCGGLWLPHRASSWETCECLDRRMLRRHVAVVWLFQSHPHMWIHHPMPARSGRRGRRLHRLSRPASLASGVRHSLIVCPPSFLLKES